METTKNPKSPPNVKRGLNPSCPNCRIELGIVDTVGMPKSAKAYACKECGELFTDELAWEYYQGILDGKPEFWMGKKGGSYAWKEKGVGPVNMTEWTYGRN
jgi:hypothetical protein